MESVNNFISSTAFKTYAPMPKFLGRFSKSGFTTFFCSTFFGARGAACSFFLPFRGLSFGYSNRLGKTDQLTLDLLHKKRGLGLNFQSVPIAYFHGLNIRLATFLVTSHKTVGPAHPRTH